MPCLSARFDPALGPLITIGIAPAGSFIQVVTAGTPTGTVVPALIDTGAAVTCIAPHIAQGLNLRPIGKRPMLSATHAVPVDLYLVDLALTFGNLAIPLPGMQVMEFPQGNPNAPYHALLGRDVICRGAFTLSFDGHFTFSI